MRLFLFLLATAACLSLGATQAPAQIAASAPGAAANAADAAADVEHRFDASLDPHEMSQWMQTMAAEPNQVGSVHDRANADWVAAQFRSWG